jgi:flagellar M-ring protein FliF
MFENLMQIREQAEELWGNLDTKARIVIISAFVVSVIALLFISNWASQPNYVTLFNDLATKDAGAITDRLKEEQIDYKLSNGGNEILVPADIVHQVRLDLASSGLPKGGVVGFELFDKTKLGSTDFEQKVNFYRALSGELSRTIKQLKNVEFARVQISAPRESLYIDKAKTVKASVLLKLNPYAEINFKQVKGITNLVGSSVEDLKPGNVTVVDTNGRLLTAQVNNDGQMGSSGFSPKQLEMEEKFENDIQTALTTMLSRVLGPDNVVIRVNADLNFDQREVQSKIYEPVNDDEGIIRSKESKEVDYEGGGERPQGVPGMESNVPQYKSSTEGEGTNYNQEEITTNYEINEKVESYIQAVGEVKKLSVAVMVNKDLSVDQKESIQDSIAAAIGYNEKRGDNITVTNFKFDKSLEEEINAEMKATRENTRNKWIIVGIVTLLVVLIGGIIIRRMMTDSEFERESSVDVMVGDETGTEQAATQEKEEEPLSPEEVRRKEMKEEISDLVKDQPEEVARLLKTWLTEE